MTEDNPLARATDTINGARIGEVQEHQILTINDQIVEHDNEIAAAETAIDAMQERVRQLRRDIKRREKEQTKLRAQRAIFAQAAHDLKQVMMP